MEEQVEKYIDLKDIPESTLKPLPSINRSPNFFFSINLKSKGLQDIVKIIQSDLKKENSVLSDTFIELGLLHITFCVCHIPNQESLDRAIYECGSQLKSIVDSVIGTNNLVLTLEKLEMIEDRVLYINIKKDEDKLHRLGASLIYYLRKIGLVKNTEKLDWTIHITIAKLSRAIKEYPNWKEWKQNKHIYVFPNKILEKYNVLFGQYSVDEIEFNSMQVKDGHYPVLYHIPFPSYTPLDTLTLPESLIPDISKFQSSDISLYKCPYCECQFHSSIFLDRHTIIHTRNTININQVESPRKDSKSKNSLPTVQIQVISVETKQNQESETKTFKKPTQQHKKAPIKVVSVTVVGKSDSNKEKKTIQVKDGSIELTFELIQKHLPSYSSLTKSAIQVYLPMLQKQHL